MTGKLRCAGCGRAVAPRKENRFFPFCSERCKLVDLGKWLGGAYRIPGPEATDADLVEALRGGGRDDGGGEDG